MNATTTRTTRFLPSTPAAIVAGALVMPLYMFGWRMIEMTFHSQLLVFLWSIVAFFTPVLLSTVDIKYFVGRRRESGSFFRLLTSSEEFRLFYIPAWKRMFVWFISAAGSALLLRAAGIEF